MFKNSNNNDGHESNHILLLDDDTVCQHNKIATKVQRVYRQEKPIRLSDASQLKTLGQCTCIDCRLENKAVCTCSAGKKCTNMTNKNNTNLINSKMENGNGNGVNNAALSEKFNEDIIFTFTNTDHLSTHKPFSSTEDENSQKWSPRFNNILIKSSSIRSALMKRFRQRYRKSRNYLIGQKKSFQSLVWIMKPIKCLHKSVCNIPEKCKANYEQYLINSDDSNSMDENYPNPIDSEFVPIKNKDSHRLKLISEVQITSENKPDIDVKIGDRKNLYTLSTDSLVTNSFECEQNLKPPKTGNKKPSKNSSNYFAKKLMNYERESGGGNSYQEGLHGYLSLLTKKYPKYMNGKYGSNNSSHSSISSSCANHLKNQGHTLTRPLGRRRKLKLKDLFPDTDETNKGVYIEYFNKNKYLEDMQFKHSKPFIREMERNKATKTGSKDQKKKKTPSIQLKQVTQLSAKISHCNRNKFVVSSNLSKSKTILIKPQGTTKTSEVHKKNVLEFDNGKANNVPTTSKSTKTSNSSKVKYTTNSLKNKQQVKQESYSSSKYSSSRKETTTTTSNSNNSNDKTTIHAKSKSLGIADGVTADMANYAEVAEQLKRKIDSIDEKKPNVYLHKVTANSPLESIQSKTIAHEFSFITKLRNRTDMASTKGKKAQSNKEMVLARLKTLTKDKYINGNNNININMNNSYKKEPELKQPCKQIIAKGNAYNTQSNPKNCTIKSRNAATAILASSCKVQKPKK